MPIPGAAGWIAAGAAALTAFIDNATATALFAVLAFALLAAWMVIYVRISAPVNRQLTAVSTSAIPTGADPRALQRRWDSVIYARAGLQLLALLSLCLAIAAV
ncbi:hypothetical protein [Nocardia acidivorans]|uniref:hypothetical protein n=1 Tax=Nocardia acidivorans TaxID=404580 RepID=UPI00083675DD|nr:hypothetical protein [Nocardia acidivorans]